jgi:hypothetical protein
VRQPLTVNLLSEILVIGEENPVFGKGSLNHFLVVYASCFFIDGEDIVLLSPKPTCDGRASVLIDKKAHEDLLQAKRHEIGIL